jgi:hypothetical protein
MIESVPNIRRVRVEADRALAIVWRGGAESLVDVGKHLATFSVFAPLRRSDKAFSAVRIGEWGWSLHWSDDMEISSDSLWRMALGQGAAWLKAWRTERGMTQTEAAASLGVSPRMWRYYEAGTHLLPKTVRLACIGFDAEARSAA